MKVIGNTYKNENMGTVKVTSAGKKTVTLENIETGEVNKSNRSKFEWMVSKGVFELVELNPAFA